MTKKLLNKTTGSFLAFSVLILVIAAPVFYFISEVLYIYETDEVLLFHKGDFVKDSRNFSEDDIAAWNKYNRDVLIVPDMGVTKDSIFGKSLFDSISGEKEPFRLLYAPVEINGKQFTYIEKSNLVEMEGMVISIAVMFLVIIIILLIGIILLSNRLAKRIWSPFYNTLQQIQDFEIDKNNPPHFIDNDIDEFSRLNNSLDRLIEKNTAIYKSQREFVENAAHELQTPLALFQTKLDTLSQSSGLSEEQSGLIGSLNNDVSRMNRLNKNLLLLSKIDNDSYFEKHPVVFNDYIEKHLDFFIEQAASKSVAVVVKLSKRAAVNTNPVLAEVLINNLFLNAIRHNTDNGKIVITTTSHSITFSNTGQDVPLNAEKLFNRFSKADSSTKGNGLGLAIVKKIIELNRWDISYNFHEGLHNFTVKF
ncbi:sensor histidine kinase [Flavobacterium album]|uniref:histidine kinase n=1 Tax=Flavobacterium album TaxID=2175091 RepID=A0A2S1QU44_9FLAO|nr:HAMP domain-containing sensor histidine kinase [Flavobacterium album]AWH83927.1 sensor histidine kinase [Flavobacterium album]